MDFIEKLVNGRGFKPETADKLSTLISVLLVIVICVIAHIIIKYLVLKVVAVRINKNKYKWDDILLERRVFHRLSNIIPAIIVYFSAPIFKDYQETIKRLVSACILIIIVFVINSVLDSINDIYKMRKISKTRPIKGLLQVAKIIVIIIMGIVTVATLIGESPVILLSGIGALSAVFSLVFKDSILGFVAGIQLTSNNLLRIGDWIEMPKYGADGVVTDISLNTVKVQNFDNTIVSIPAYTLISDSFKNWRGMQESGGRRIMRSIYIDTNSIEFSSKETIEKYKKIRYIKDYINKKEKEIETYNREIEINDESLVNGRHITNIGTFRIYIENYLENHPKIHKDMLLIVRQQPPNEHGLPLQIYAFTNDIVWKNYERIQSDIFDHIFAVSKEFGLRIFQNPTGYDLRQADTFKKYE